MSRPTFQILVAEPDDVQRQFVDMLLSDASFALTIVGTGREALEHLKEHSPDLCLLALDLPDVSGDEIGGKIRRVSRLARTPVVLISPQAGRFGLSDEARARARRSGADLVLPRPLGDKNLRDRIQSLLDAREQTPDREGYSTRIIDDALDEIEEIPEEVELGHAPTMHVSGESAITGKGARDAHDGSDSARASGASGTSEAVEASDRSEASEATDREDTTTNDTPSEATPSHSDDRRQAGAKAAEGGWASGVAHGADTREAGHASGQRGGALRDASDESKELAQVRKDREILKVENAQLKRKLKEKAEQLEKGVNQKLERKINELERRNSALLEEIEKLKSDRGGGGLFGRRS